MISEEIALNEHLERQRHHAGGDRSRRIHPATAPRTAEPHHRPGLPPQPRGLGGAVSASAHTDLPADRVLRRAARHPDRGARPAAGEIPRRRCRHHRRQFPDRRDRQQRHRHQRGQRRPDADAAARAHRARQHREGRADAGGHDEPAAPAGALGHRAGVFRLHHVLHRAAARRRSRRAGANTMSCCSTTAARRWSAPSSRTCCAASAAPPA